MTSITLVTGATGLLGLATLRALSPVGEVYALVRQLPKDRIEGVRYLVANLGSELVAELLPPRVDRVIHLAQSTRFREMPEQALDLFSVNVSSTAFLLDYARRCGAQQFIFASTGGVYKPSLMALKESDPIIPIEHVGFYVGSKVAAEMLVHAFSTYMQVVVLRFFFIYGAGQRQDMLIPRLIESVRNRRPIRLDGFNGIQINPIHVEDAVDSVIAATGQAETMTVNVAGPSNLSIREISNLIGSYFEIEPLFEIQNNSELKLVANTELMRNRLNVPKREFAKVLHSIIPAKTT